MKRAAAVAAACAGLVVAAGCSSGPSVNNSIAPQTSATAPATGMSGSGRAVPGGSPTSAASAAPSSAPPASQVAGVGDAVVVSGNTAGEQLTVTLMSVVDPAHSASFTPDAGMKFVGLRFRVTNSGSSVYDDSPANCVSAFTATDEQAQTTIGDITSGSSLNSVRLTPGESAVGYLVVQAPTATHLSRVQYTPDSGFANDTAEWTVNRYVPGPGSAPTTVPPAAPTTPLPVAPGTTAATSSPQQVVESYFAAINAQDYQTAWDLGGKNLDSSYQHFAAGFAGTAQDNVTVTNVSGNTVSVQLDAVQTDGSTRHFSGTYTVRHGQITSAQIH